MGGLSGNCGAPLVAGLSVAVPTTRRPGGSCLNFANIGPRLVGVPLQLAAHRGVEINHAGDRRVCVLDEWHELRVNCREWGHIPA